jgi:hypothetical protein
LIRSHLIFELLQQGDKLVQFILQLGCCKKEQRNFTVTRWVVACSQIDEIFQGA